MGAWTALGTFSEDVRYGIRLLRKTPGWTTMMTATLVGTIGLATGIFSLVYSLLIQPLPYREPDRLMALWSTGLERGQTRFNVSGADWQDWRRRTHLFEDIALTRPVANFNLTGSG